MAMMGLQFPANQPRYADLRAELLSFPAGKHDDQVDALGLVGQLLDQMSGDPIIKKEIDSLLRKGGYQPPADESSDSDSILLL
jgi:hypothetical protein